MIQVFWGELHVLSIIASYVWILQYGNIGGAVMNIHSHPSCFHLYLLSNTVQIAAAHPRPPSVDHIHTALPSCNHFSVLRATRSKNKLSVFSLGWLVSNWEEEKEGGSHSQMNSRDFGIFFRVSYAFDNLCLAVLISRKTA